VCETRKGRLHLHHNVASILFFGKNNGVKKIKYGFCFQNKKFFLKNCLSGFAEVGRKVDICGSDWESVCFRTGEGYSSVFPPESTILSF
jgi:hypothetical protein